MSWISVKRTEKGSKKDFPYQNVSTLTQNLRIDKMELSLKEPFPS